MQYKDYYKTLGVPKDASQDDIQRAYRKLARKYHHAKGDEKRYRVITFINAFHGRSLAAIAASGKEKLIKGFGPMPDWFDFVPFIDIDALKAVISDETAAILIEPVQGEGGILPAKKEQLQRLRNIADEHGLLLELGGQDDGDRVNAPIAPGYYREVQVRSHRMIDFGENIAVQGPGVLAFDGERERVLKPGQHATFSLSRSGPLVVDVEKTLHLAAEKGCFTR